MVKLVKLLIQIDATITNAKDHLGRTPLIMAAINAGGRLSISGIADTEIIDALLDAGASKSDVDNCNMTAYGHFKSVSSNMVKMTWHENRHTVTNVEHKLYPPGGPSIGDFSEGKGGSSGLIDYSAEDGENSIDEDGDY